MYCERQDCSQLARFFCERCRTTKYCSLMCCDADDKSHRSRCFVDWSSQSKDVVVDLPDLRRLFIGGVDSKIPFADLHLFFSKFGPVHHLQKPNDTDWLKIEFKDKLAALLCLLSKPLQCKKYDGNIKKFRVEVEKGDDLRQDVAAFLNDFCNSTLVAFGTPYVLPEAIGDDGPRNFAADDDDLLDEAAGGEPPQNEAVPADAKPFTAEMTDWMTMNFLKGKPKRKEIVAELAGQGARADGEVAATVVEFSPATTAAATTDESSVANVQVEVDGAADATQSDDEFFDAAEETFGETVGESIKKAEDFSLY